MSTTELDVHWEANCNALARMGDRGACLALAQDPECSLSALRYMAHYSPDDEVCSVAIDMLVQRLCLDYVA